MSPLGRKNCSPRGSDHQGPGLGVHYSPSFLPFLGSELLNPTRTGAVSWGYCSLELDSFFLSLPAFARNGLSLHIRKWALGLIHSVSNRFHSSWGLRYPRRPFGTSAVIFL